MRDYPCRQGKDNKIATIRGQETVVENPRCECSASQPAKASIVQGKFISRTA